MVNIVDSHTYLDIQQIYNRYLPLLSVLACPWRQRKWIVPLSESWGPQLNAGLSGKFRWNLFGGVADLNTLNGRVKVSHPMLPSSKPLWIQNTTPASDVVTPWWRQIYIDRFHEFIEINSGKSTKVYTSEICLWIISPISYMFPSGSTPQLPWIHSYISCGCYTGKPKPQYYVPWAPAIDIHFFLSPCLLVLVEVDINQTQFGSTPGHRNKLKQFKTEFIYDSWPVVEPQFCAPDLWKTYYTSNLFIEH